MLQKDRALRCPTEDYARHGVSMPNRAAVTGIPLVALEAGVGGALWMQPR
ncbi:hypothetical protein TI01_1201 [Lysobacter sp. A03]|nr:hypothetical protein TI01_1201 [Lysobacter sp. A03]